MSDHVIITIFFTARKAWERGLRIEVFADCRIDWRIANCNKRLSQKYSVLNVDDFPDLKKENYLPCVQHVRQGSQKWWITVLISRGVYCIKWMQHPSRQYKVHKWAMSQCFKSFLRIAKLPSNWRKLQNNSLLRWKNTKDVIINQTGTRMVEDGED